MASARVDIRNSERLYASACGLIPGGVNSALRRIEPPLVVERVEGAVMRDVDGREYIDYHGAFGPALLGHNHPFVRQKVFEAIENYVLAGVGTTELEIEVARKLSQHIPSAQRVLLCNTGSEATFHALRVARAVTGKKKIIKFQGCYHGTHDYVLRSVTSAAGRPGNADAALAGALPEALENTLVCEFNNLDDVESTIAANRGNIAAVIVEPIAHNMGCVMPQPGFLEGIRSITSANNAVLIFDEVITGFRHHLGGYQAICGVTPDLTTLGKAMGNGFTISALCGKQEIMERFSTFATGDTYFAGTFNGNAVGCAAALAVIDVLEREPVHQHIFRLGERMRKGLSDIHSRLGVRATVAGFGSIFLSYFMNGPIRNYADLSRNDIQRFVDYRRRLIDRGIFKMPVNLKRNHIGYGHSNAHIDKTLDVCEDTLKKTLH